MGLLITVIDIAFNILIVLIFVRVVLSWVRVSPYHPTWGGLVTFVYRATDPIMEPVQRIMPPMGGLDFSPIIVLFGLSILRQIIISLLVG